MIKCGIFTTKISFSFDPFHVHGHILLMYVCLMGGSNRVVDLIKHMAGVTANVN
jgi:hypothetical protein